MKTSCYIIFFICFIHEFTCSSDVSFDAKYVESEGTSTQTVTKSHLNDGVEVEQVIVRAATAADISFKIEDDSRRSCRKEQALNNKKKKQSEKDRGYCEWLKCCFGR